ncbi:Ig-like domain-containing protein [Nonomuraea sp. NPDC050153]|uniref:Ig-like domain-containing protein n=1 Tax=Nonomuraea sp. NPDC050153 TaxID=3364359 RepID=UPI0037919664
MKVWANADGKTLHAELSTEPVQLRVAGKGGEKTWQPVDTSIVAKDDGTLAAKLVKTPLTFGGEGATILVTADDKDGTVTVGWDRKLPKPTVDGNTITYPDAVAKGADVVLTVRPNGFTQDVVLRSRPQEPIKVTLPVVLPKGKTYGRAADGRPQLRSAQGTAETAPLITRAVDAKAVEAPGQGRTGNVDTSVATDSAGRSELVLTPDAAFLADPSVTYPVVVPMSGEWIGAGDSSDTFVSSVQYPNSATLFTWLRAGKSADGELWRTYLRYMINGTDLDYATIVDADLRLWNYHASGCGTTVGVGIVARRLTKSYDYSTLTWANQPSSTGTNAVVAPGGYSSTLAGCSGSGELYHSIETMTAAMQGQRWFASEVGTDLLDTSGTGGGEDEADDTAPTVVSVSPSPGASGVPVDAKVSATFSEEVIGASVTLQAADGTAVSGTIDADASGTKVTFTPSAPLAGGTRYTATITGAQDIWDNVVGDYSWTFTTVSDCPPAQDPDTTAPAIRALTPLPEATGVSGGSPVSVTFCEPVNDPVLSLEDAAGTAVGGAVTVDQSRTTVTFTPSATLPPGIRYTAEISGAADDAGNVMTAHSWSFTTMSTVPPDTTPPAVTETTPGSGAADVALSAQVRVAYSEPVTGVQITLSEAGGTPVPGTVSMAEADVAVFTPSAPLEAGTAYTATAGGGTDAAGNAQAAHAWSFITIPAAAEPVNPNPYFESEIDPWYAYFEEDELTRSTEQAHEGTASAKFAPLAGTGGAAAETFEISEGTDYGLSGWFYPAASSVEGFNFGIEWYDVGFNLLSSDNFPIEETLGQWQQVSGPATAPVGAAYAVIYVDGAATIYFDEVTLIPAGDLTAARGGGSAKKAREHGPASHYLPKGQSRSKAKVTAASDDPPPATAPFNPQHLSVENCRDTDSLGEEYYARIQERPYTSCWSAQILIQDFIWDKEKLKWKRKVKKTGWIGAAIDAIEDLTTDELALEFHATYVMHSYLGNSTGRGVEGAAAGSTLLPQNFKVFTRLEDFNIRGGDGSEHRAEAEKITFKLDLTLAAGEGATCRIQEGSAQEKTVAAWRQAGNTDFLVKVDTAREGTCKYAPMITKIGDLDTRMGFWTDWVVGERGQKTGVLRGGFGTGSDDTFVPSVRCDSIKFSANEPHTGGCINPAANRLFTMSRTKDSSFLQVIKHIEDALKQDGRPDDNRRTVPPLRTTETQVPPVKGLFGNEKTKTIPGNWNAPEGTDKDEVEPGDPLVRGPAGTSTTNRRVFSPRFGFTVNGTRYTNYCRYYYPERYVDPIASQLDPDRKIHCDEYPFASTRQGAASANGNYSLLALSARHNTGRGSHGQALLNFYARYRVGAENPFWVNIVP